MTISVKIRKTVATQDGQYYLEYEPAEQGLSQAAHYGVTVPDLDHLDDVEFEAAVGINTAIAGQAPSIEDLQEIKIAIFRKSIRNFIYSQYDDGTQASLNAMMSGAIATGNLARLAYISTALAWVQDCLTAYFTAKSSILAMTEAGAVQATSIDYAALLNSKPAVSVAGARGI